MRNLVKKEIKKAVKRTTVILLLSLTFMMLLTPIPVHAVSWKLYHWNSAESLSEWEFTPPHLPTLSPHINTTAGYYQEGNGSLQLHTVPETQGTVEFLLNNGFEDGVISPWTGAGTISSTYYHNGSKSMQVDPYAYTTYTFTPFQTHKANVSLFEFWSRYPSGGGNLGTIVIMYENSTGTNKEKLMSPVYSTSSFVKTVVVNSTYTMPAWGTIEANSIIKGIKLLTHYSAPWYVDDWTFEAKYTYGNPVGWANGLQAKYPIKEYVKDDYILNPSFEDGIGNWTGGVTQSGTYAHSGSYSGLLNYDDAQQTWAWTSAPLKEDVKEFSFWTRNCPISSSSLSVQFYNGTGYYWASSFGLVYSGGVWVKDIVKNETQHYGLWGYIPSGAYITGIRITEYGGYTWHVDDVSLTAWAQLGFDFGVASPDWILIHSRDYFGFWIYIDVDTFPSHTVNFIAGRRWLVLDSSNFFWQGIQIYKASGTSQVQYKHTYSLNQSGDPFTNVANKVWLYVEMHDYQYDETTTAYEMHINGTARTTLLVNPEVLHNWGIFYVKFPVSTYVGMAFVDYINVNNGWQFPPLYPDDLADIDVSTPDLEAGEWVFAQEKFYTFNVTARVPVGVSGWDFVSISFQDEGDHNITVLYDVANNEFTIPNESSDEHERYIRVQQVEGMPLQDPLDNRTFYIDFEIWFTENIVDTYDHLIDIYGWGNYSTGEFETCLIGEDVFKIYNRGGFSLNYETTGSAAYRIAGGDTFELYAQSSMAVEGTEWVYADYLWRNLQHIKELFQIQARVAYPAFTLSYGMDYYTNYDGWIHGWELQLDAINVTVPRVSGSEAYWAWRAEWYLNDVFIKQDYFFTFPQGNPLNDGDYASSRIWLDFWFNSMNGSSTWGGRVNSYYYPVKDNADAWLRVLSTNWGADDKRAKESLCFGTLRHDDGSPLQTQEIIFVSAWSKVTVANHASLTQKVTQFYADVQDLTLGKIPLIGIQTPAFDETKMPALQTGGFLGMLFSGFQSIGKWLADNIVWGGLNLWGNFVGFLDTIAAMFGAPNFFTNLFTRIGEGIDYMVQGFGYAFQILGQIFILISSLLGAFVSVLTDLISSLINTITTFQDIMGGAIGGAGNLWNDLGIANWIMVALVFYPLYLIFLWEDQGMEPVLTQLGWIFGIASWLFNFFIQIIQFVIGMITSIIESIPVAE